MLVEPLVAVVYLCVKTTSYKHHHLMNTQTFVWKTSHVGPKVPGEDGMGGVALWRRPPLVWSIYLIIYETHAQRKCLNFLTPLTHKSE